MYTQCPECSVAFRVTAEVLRQAAGKVRCGGCGIAFNALEHLSEQRPEAPRRPDPDQPVPELKPDEPGELQADTPPESISAEQSAALLKTLDQLAGSDIRIEDTGVEWRVLDEGEDAGDDEIDEIGDSELIADTGTLKFIVQGDDEDDAIDEILEDSPTPVDQFLTDTPPRVDAPELFETMRFDDNTPLPEDFDLDSPAPPAAKPPPEPAKPVETYEDAQVDLELGDPDEWEDLLGEVDAATAADIDEDISAEAEIDEASRDELVVLADAVTGDASEQPLDLDTQFDIQAEAMGIDLSGLHASIDEDEAEPDADESDAEEEEGDEAETSIDEDLIAAAFKAEAAARKTPAIDPGDEDEDATTDEEDEDIAELADSAAAELDEAHAEADDDELELDIELEAEEEAELVDEFKRTPVDERSLEISLDDDGGAGDDASDEHVIPEMTEEEKTINMLIDQDLLSVAVEDEDGFASTIVQVQPDRKVEGELGANKKKSKAESTDSERPAAKKSAAPQPFETIVMEGEEIRDELEDERKAKNRKLVEEAMRKAKEEEERLMVPARVPKAGMIAAAVVLALLLVAQVLHQSREALATVPAFNDTVAPLYRMIGKPLTPAWDITGWRFEATKGSTDEGDEVLTIYSRIGNQSDAALPYPLVHVSLTDRFEDIIGSRVLEPGEYLPSDMDPRELVPAGNTFSAVISIESPSTEATGFKLNVCYRQASGRLRCAIEDFK